MPSILSEETRGRSPVTADLIRQELVEHAKNFKRSWLKLGQSLYPVWKDKWFYTWGYDKFEYYTQKELGIKKPTAIKLLKSYFFLEQDEPAYLNEEFSESREAPKVPDCDSINVLRMARGKKELTKDDYQELRRAIFDKGKDSSQVRKDLTALLRERKEVDPDEERKQRSAAAIRRFLSAAQSFRKDMETLKLIPGDLLEETDSLLKKLEKELD